ncbi:hypothetical protein QBC46DRAFT_395888 [Diplogelasinospora grovesii]|uniref:Tryptophan synthase beta chain-like PALP domain-containing protein n=1 Tax=Diplogelasinospora grovesii TaxID=303347 RepID=A0AAN6N0T1_9PEZI|nr:hypothetical protein QBC46DRAFT_395888 [Diplogelasinospora grovesii]
MCGMNCGTLSTTAWLALKEGVDASVVVEDKQAHEAVLELEGVGVKAGPCGAATLAAFTESDWGRRKARVGVG